MKMNINKLIANDIINWGREKTISRDYSIYIGSGYLNEFDEDTQKYIRNNFNLISEDIKNSDCVSNAEYQEDRDVIDIVYEYNFCLTELEQIINNIAEENEVNLQLDGVQKITANILNDRDFYNVLKSKVNTLKFPDDMEI